jgi:hypothetical protein
MKVVVGAESHPVTHHHHLAGSETGKVLQHVSASRFLFLVPDDLHAKSLLECDRLCIDTRVVRVRNWIKFEKKPA